MVVAFSGSGIQLHRAQIRCVAEHVHEQLIFCWSEVAQAQNMHCSASSILFTVCSCTATSQSLLNAVQDWHGDPPFFQGPGVASLPFGVKSTPTTGAGRLPLESLPRVPSIFASHMEPNFSSRVVGCSLMIH